MKKSLLYFLSLFESIYKIILRAIKRIFFPRMHSSTFANLSQVPRDLLERISKNNPSFRYQKHFMNTLLLAICFLITSCQSSSNAVWEDTKTMGRYLHRKGKLLWRQDVDSRMIEIADEFIGPSETEFVPLKAEDLKTQFANLNIPQPKESPGLEGSSIPSIDHFSAPTADLVELFKNVYFNTNEHVLRKKEYYHSIDQIAGYMKKNPNVYIFVSGHCDERASEAYNLALGTRRANTIRSLLVKKGVNPNHIYTISFGKEMPVDLGHTAEAWSKNRRVEFKIFKKE